MFELPKESNKHPNFEWRGQGRGADSFVLLSYPIWVQCLNKLSPIVDLDLQLTDLKNTYPARKLSI